MQRVSEPWSNRWLYVGLSLAVAAVYWLPYVLQAWDAPLLFSLTIREDGLYEAAGGLACLLAAVILAYTYVTYGPRPGDGGSRWRNPWFPLLSLFFFVMAGEELSWGQRMIGLGTPDWLRAINLQNELTLHNLSIFQPEIGTNRFQEIWIAAVSIYFGVLPWLARFEPVRRLVDAARLPLASLPVAWANLLNALALVISNRDQASEGVSLRIKLGEESFETVAECLFVCFALTIYLRAKPASQKSDRGLWRWAGAVGLLGAVVLGWHMVAHTLPAAQSDRLVEMGNRLVASEDIDGAVQRYREAVQLAPDNAVAHMMLGLIYQRRDEPMSAIAAFEQALVAMPDLVDAEVNLGLIRLEQGNPEAAEEHFRRAVELAPYSVEAHNNLGAALVRLGRLTEAVRRFEMARELAPDDPNIERNLQETRKLMTQE